MFKRVVVSSVASIGLLLGIALAVAAQIPASPSQFQPIEQPLGLKIGVTLAGLALIGLELWWFLSKRQVK